MKVQYFSYIIVGRTNTLGHVSGNFVVGPSAVQHSPLFLRQRSHILPLASIKSRNTLTAELCYNLSFFLTAFAIITTRLQNKRNLKNKTRNISTLYDYHSCTAPEYFISPWYIAIWQNFVSEVNEFCVSGNIWN